MNPNSLRKFAWLIGAAIAMTMAAAAPASAVPAFAEQTGLRCAACHVGGLGPQLTAFGRNFKIGGYTLRAGPNFTAPVSAMLEASYVNTAKDQSSPPAPHYGDNNNATIDQASLFVAGGVGDHFGGFTQWTYDGVGRAFAWDNLDLRAVDHLTVSGSDVLVGLSLNNAPAVEDAWNTLPAWGYPYSGSDLSPAPATTTIFDGGLAQSVLGVTAYAYWDSSIYTEAGLYWTPSHGFLTTFGTDEGPGPIDGAAPYFRLAYQKDFGAQNFEIGAFGFFPDLHPGGDTSTGKADSYKDYGIDGSYQFLDENNNYYTLNARYTHEEEDLAATRLLGGAAKGSDTLDDFRFDGSYYWHNKIGATVQFFNTTGSADPLLYADNLTFKPDSTGVEFQIDGTPWGDDVSPFGPRFNLRVGLQYTLYTKFDGASSNYDGTGRNASDNDTFRIFTWFAL